LKNIFHSPVLIFSAEMIAMISGSEGPQKTVGLIQLPSALLRTAGIVYPSPGLRRLKDKAKYVGRGLLTPGLTCEWFTLLARPEMGFATHAQPRIYSKLQRPYLHKDLPPAARLAALREHYRFALGKLSPAALEKIYSTRETRLLVAEIPELGAFSIRLIHRQIYEKEGELTLSLFDDRVNRPMFALSFTIYNTSPERREMFIGGLQGAKRHNDGELIVAVTRGMNGLRPKALLLFAAQQIAAHWEVKIIRAVSDAQNIFRDIRLSHKKVMASYDAFWTDSDGKIDADGLFTLPPRFEPRPIAEVKPNKRSLYKKRYAMLEDFTAQLQNNLRALERQPDA
jgi:hypothetical protein